MLNYFNNGFIWKSEIKEFFFLSHIHLLPIEPRRQKTGLRGFRPGPTQTGLYSHRKWLEAWNFVFRKERDCTVRVAKMKALISFAVTAKLICVFVFAYAKIRFSHVAAQFIIKYMAVVIIWAASWKKNLLFAYIWKQRPCADLENVLMWWDPASDQGGPDIVSLSSKPILLEIKGTRSRSSASAHE